MEIQLNTGMTRSQSTVDALMADFSGLVNLEKIVFDVLEKLGANQAANVALVKSGGLSMSDFDKGFAEAIRKELGRVLGILRNKAISKARAAGAGSASTAVLRRTYKGEFAGNINIGNNRRAAASTKREVDEPTGGASGIRRKRSVKARTKRIREYYGPDRGFILRILESGREEFMATSDGPTGRGSMATHGRRGSIGARNWFFHSMSSDMELAAKELGETLVGHVEKWVERKMKSEG